MRCLFAQLKIGEEFYFESKKFRKVSNAEALDIKAGENAFFDQFDSVEKIS
jgi:hypothetical protein